MAKESVQKQTHRTTQKHAEHQDAADIQNILFPDFYNFILLMISLMISPTIFELCLGTVNDFLAINITMYSKVIGKPN